MSHEEFVIGCPTPLPLTRTKERTTMGADSPEAVALTNDAIAAGIASEEKRAAMLRLAKYHGTDALRDVVRVIAMAKLKEDGLAVLKTCGVSLEQYIAGKARQKRGR